MGGHTWRGTMVQNTGPWATELHSVEARVSCCVSWSDIRLMQWLPPSSSSLSLSSRTETGRLVTLQQRQASREPGLASHAVSHYSLRLAPPGYVRAWSCVACLFARGIGTAASTSENPRSAGPPAPRPLWDEGRIPFTDGRLDTDLYGTPSPPAEPSLASRRHHRNVQSGRGCEAAREMLRTNGGSAAHPPNLHNDKKKTPDGSSDTNQQIGSTTTACGA
ncbi:hypothetical protein ColTof3_14141 [Colletotrichum tofieldiae]|nr:hypothetical protein ColTof3_14141 [Colletotrichum tofieldiae]